MKKPKGAEITFEDIINYLGKIPKGVLKENDDFVNDRHWEGGKYWIGWRPVPDEKGLLSQAATLQWNYVCQSFTQKNVIGSNVSRLTGAILGNEPDFDIIAKSAETESADLPETPTATKKPKTKDEEFFEEVDEAMVEWWTQNEVHQTFKNLLKCRASFGKTAVLVYIPDGYLSLKTIEKEVDGKTEKVSTYGFDDETLTFEQVLSRIKVKVLHYEDVIDVNDTAFGNKFSIVRLASYRNDELSNDQLSGELIERYGIFYVDTNGASCLRIVTSDKKESTISCDLGGNNMCLTFGEYADTLITNSVKTLQKGVNHAETGSNYALANINYPETTFINAMPIEQVDANGNSTGKKVAPKSGLGVFRYLSGFILESINGQTVTTPAIHEREGADPEKFSKEAEKKSRDIDMLMGMGFKHLADSEYASGDSKAKSMDDLDILIADYETTMNTIGTKVFENVVRLAFHFTGQSSRNKDFNVLFKVNMSQGKLTETDKSGMREEVSLGLRSDENYMLATKVTDNPKREKQRIAAQPPKQLNEPAKPPTSDDPKG